MLTPGIPSRRALLCRTATLCLAVAANKSLGIDQVTACDGADVMPPSLPGFPQGLLVVHDGENDGFVSSRNTNLKFVPWPGIANTFAPALVIARALGFRPACRHQPTARPT